MAWECYRGNARTGIAGADLSTHQFKFVKDSGATIVLSGAGNRATGVLQNKPTSGQAGTVWGEGNTSKVIAGAAVAAGAEIMSDASGRAVTATSTNHILGYAENAAGAAGEVLAVRLQYSGIKP